MPLLLDELFEDLLLGDDLLLDWLLAEDLLLADENEENELDIAIPCCERNKRDEPLQIAAGLYRTFVQEQHNSPKRIATVTLAKIDKLLALKIGLQIETKTLQSPEH